MITAGARGWRTAGLGRPWETADIGTDAIGHCIFPGCCWLALGKQADDTINLHIFLPSQQPPDLNGAMTRGSLRTGNIITTINTDYQYLRNSRCQQHHYKPSLSVLYKKLNINTNINIPGSHPYHNKDRNLSMPLAPLKHQTSLSSSMPKRTLQNLKPLQTNIINTAADILLILKIIITSELQTSSLLLLAAAAVAAKQTSHTFFHLVLMPCAGTWRRKACRL